MPINSLLIFSSKLTLSTCSVMLHQTFQPFLLYSGHSVRLCQLSAKEAEGTVQNSGASPPGSGCCIWLCLAPAAGFSHGAGVWERLLELCLSCVSSVHGPSMTSRPWPGPGDRLAKAPSTWILPVPGLVPPAVPRCPLHTYLPVLAYLYSEGCFLVLGN